MKINYIVYPLLKAIKFLLERKQIWERQEFDELENYLSNFIK